jgi:transposase InsO family protein
MHLSSIYAIDFFTVDTVTKAAYYVFFVISHKTREIVNWAVTQNPVNEFVRQQMIRLIDKIHGPIYLLRDNGSQLGLNYESLAIKEGRTSIISAIFKGRLLL